MGDQMGIRSYVPPHFSSRRFSRKWVMSWMDAPFLLSDCPCFFKAAHVRPSPCTRAHVALSLWDSSDRVLRARHCALYSVPFLKTMFSLFFEPWTVNCTLRYWYPIFSWFYFMYIWLLWPSIFKAVTEIKSRVCSVFSSVHHRPPQTRSHSWFLSFFHPHIQTIPKSYQLHSWTISWVFSGSPSGHAQGHIFLAGMALAASSLPLPFLCPCDPFTIWQLEWAFELPIRLSHSHLSIPPVVTCCTWYRVWSLSMACKAQCDLVLLNLPPHLLGLSLLWTTSPADFVLSLKEITRS